MFMGDSKLYEDIFEAVRQLEPSNPLPLCKDRGGILQRHMRAQLLGLGDGTYAAIPVGPNFLFYRGEKERYPSSKPNYYRIPVGPKRIVSDIKKCDFELFLLETDEIQRRLREHEKVDLLALAQHYEFPTKMLDITSDIVVAAYFATHEMDPVTRTMIPVKEGVGRLFYFHGIYEQGENAKLRVFGDQFFCRPINQCGFGYVMEETEDFQKTSSYVEFNQKYEMNQLLGNVINGAELIYPQEQIVVVAETIRNADAVTSHGIRRYAEQSGLREEELCEIVRKEGLYIVDAPLFHAATLKPWANAVMLH